MKIHIERTNDRKLQRIMCGACMIGVAHQRKLIIWPCFGPHLEEIVPKIPGGWKGWPVELGIPGARDLPFTVDPTESDSEEVSALEEVLIRAGEAIGPECMENGVVVYTKVAEVLEEQRRKVDALYAKKKTAKKAAKKAAKKTAETKEPAPVAPTTEDNERTAN